MNERLLLFIPVYNCAPQFKRLAAKLDGAALARFSEVLVADNGSSDGTLEAAREALAGKKGVSVTLVRNSGNYSLGGSLKIAFNYCLDKGYTHCAVLHGDDQADLRDLLPRLEDGNFLGHDCAFGSRFTAESKLAGYSTVRLLGNKALNLLASLAAGRRITDLGSGLNLYSAAFLKTRFYEGYPDGLTFDVHVLLHCLRSGADFIFFPISWREEDQKSNARAFRQGLEILSLLARHALGAARPAGAGLAAPHTFKIFYSHRP